MKFSGTQLFRWNIHLNVILWMLLPLPMWLPLLHQYIPIMWSLMSLFTIQAVITLCWLSVALLALTTYITIFISRNELPSGRMYNHLVCMAAHKEPLELLITTVTNQTVANQTEAYKIVLSVLRINKINCLLGLRRYLQIY